MRHPLPVFVATAVILTVLIFQLHPSSGISYQDSRVVAQTTRGPYSERSVRIYIGIVPTIPSESSRNMLISKVTSWYNFDRRLILREIYKRFTDSLSPIDKVDIRFILGHPSLTESPVDRILKMEQETYGDILMLDVLENMNNGKSYEYFATLGKMYPETLSETERPYDYAMKLDDDSFLYIPNLLEKLRPLTPRQNTWLGRGDHMLYYMFGPGYVLSWDLVTWLSNNRADLEQYINDPEDWSISEMMQWGGRAEQSWISVEEEYMDHPSLPETPWTRKFGHDVILVHGLKTVELWGDTLDYFLRNIVD